MTGYWSICVPELGTNLVSDPECTALALYNALGATVTIDNTYARFGSTCLKIVTNNAGASEGVYSDNGTSGFPATAGTTYTLSVYVRGSGTVKLWINWTNSGGSDISSTLGATITISNSGWTRYTVSGTAPALTAYVYLSVYTAAQQASTFYIDGIQLEAKAYATTFMSGNQPGCKWGGIYNASTSTRDAAYRLGGRIVDIEDTYAIRVRNATGHGAAPVDLTTAPFALQPGSAYQSDRYEERTLMLIMEPYATTTPGLHTVRRNLWNLIKPDAYGRHEPFLLAYTGNTRTVYGAFRYDGGWEMGSISGGAYKAEQELNVGLRLKACDPFWYEDDQQTAVLDYTDSIASNNYVAARISGNWQNLGTGVAGGVGGGASVVVEDKNTGRIYFGGSFSTANGVTVNSICYWNGSTFVAMGGTPGVSGGGVLSIAIAPNEDVWVGGNFTSAGGSAADGLAKWTPATNTWTCFTNGTPGDIIYSLAIDKNGLVYAGGVFANWDGNAASDNIVSYNGSAFAPLSTGTNGSVIALAIGLDGTTLYVGGSFTTPQTRMMYWNGSAFNAMASGSTGNVYTICVTHNGFVYIGGNISPQYLTLWNGSSWSSVGGGVNDKVFGISEYNGGLIVSGEFTMAGSLACNYMAFWNGSSWTQIDFIPPGTPTQVFGVSVFGDLYIGYIANAGGTATSSGQTSIANTSTAESYPIITITGTTTAGASSTLQWMENQTTKQIIYLNVTIQSGETLTIDLRPGYKTVKSNWRGVINGAILPGSESTNWRLVGGANTIAAFITGTTTGVNMLANWQVVHNSVDGAG